MTLSIGLGAVGVGLLSTTIAALIVIATEATALAMGLLRIIGNQFNIRKAEKHEKIIILAEVKLDTNSEKLDMNSDVFSKALIHNKISDEDYTRILNEFMTNREIKEEIRSKSK